MLPNMGGRDPFPLSDQELFDFNAALMGDYSDEKAHVDLEKYGDAFRLQLVAALHLDSWAARLQEDDALARRLDEKEIRGWVNALQNVAALLRQGYYLPDGLHFEEVVRRRRP